MKIFLPLLFILAATLQAAATGNEGTRAQKTDKKSGAVTLQRSSSTILFSDDFNNANDTASLRQRGYVTRYNGTGAQAGPTWFTGDSMNFRAYNGPADGYIAADFKVVSGVNRIDSWLILPALALNQGDSISFYCRSISEEYYRDSVKVMYSASGATNVNGPDWVQLAFFKTDTTGVWERKTFTAPSSGSNARFAIRYFLLNGGPNAGLSSRYIGIDQLTVATGVAGVEENSETAKISIYPNPATSVITVSSVSESGNIGIYNALGQEVLQQKIQSRTQKTDISNLPSGIYVVRVITREGIFTERLVKK